MAREAFGGFGDSKANVALVGMAVQKIGGIHLERVWR
jgi:hypothetical protein